MKKSIGLDTEEREIVERLVAKFGMDTPIGDLLKIKDKTPIEEVSFEITGILQYACESTGKQCEWNGTIKDILYEEVYDYYLFEAPTNKMKELISDEELDDLTRFFLGKRQENHVEYKKAVASRVVSFEEIKEYLSNLDVNKRFKYKDTVREY